MATSQINLTTLHLDKGSHDSRDNGVCIMEAVAWLAGEPHSDRPVCASKVITDYAMGLNDQWADTTRQRLIPYLPKIVGTHDAHDNERALLAADWLIRTYTPTWLRLAGLNEDADNLANAAPLTDWSGLADLQGHLEQARKRSVAARAAAGDAAGDAARDAAWDAAGDAAGAAAWDAAWAAAGDAAWAAAWDAARDAAWAAAGAAAWAAAGDAAWAAAGDAARAALEPTIGGLQESALDLLERMCQVGR